jgi:hypothetical protein
MALAERRRCIKFLAQPKSLPASYNEPRRSVYWENGIRPKDYTKVTEFAVTPRLEQLVQPKGWSKHYVEDLPSPIWHVKRATLSAKSSPRLCKLATPKTLHQSYQYPKPVQTVIPRHSLSAQPSPRLCLLAQHKMYPELLIKPDSEWEWSQWDSDIKPSTLKGTSSNHTIALSQPKKLVETYRPNRSAQWPVSSLALQHIASDRLVKLAHAKQLYCYQKDYKIWKVSKAALNARPSSCIENLAKPLPRKCRQKKI